MSCDIHGYIEVKKDSHPISVWSAVALINGFLGQSYSFFAKVFDVRNGGVEYVNVNGKIEVNRKRTVEDPVAPMRGIPQDASHIVQMEYWGLDDNGLSMYDDIRTQEKSSGVADPRRLVGLHDWHSPSWAFASEVLSIDWSSQAPYSDNDVLVQKYIDGQWQDANICDTSAFMYKYMLAEYKDSSEFPHEYYDLAVGKEIVRSDIKFIGVPWTWGRLRDTSWDDIIWILETLSDKYGHDNVRMVAWFDN